MIFDDLLDAMKAKSSDLVELLDTVSLYVRRTLALARKCIDDVAVVESEWRTQLEMEVGWRNIMQSVHDAKDKCNKKFATGLGKHKRQIHYRSKLWHWK